MRIDSSLPSGQVMSPDYAGASRPVWLLPALLAALSAGALLGATLHPAQVRMWTFLPFSFLGNSLAPLPYDGAVIYLGSHYPLWLIVLVGTVGTVLIEAWNMELLSRILSRDGVRGFRVHPLTQATLRMYRKAPFWSLVGTCALPIVPHYPMRVLAVLDHYPMWKYQTSIMLGRGARYLWLGAIGWALPIPGWLIFAVSLIVLAFGIRGARKMNRYEEPAPTGAVPSQDAA